MGKSSWPQCSLGGPPPTPAVSTGESGRQRPPSPSCRAPSLTGHQVRGWGWNQNCSLARGPGAALGLECSRALGPTQPGCLRGEESHPNPLGPVGQILKNPSTREPPCPSNFGTSRSTPKVKDRGSTLGLSSSAPDARVRRPQPETQSFRARFLKPASHLVLSLGAVTLSPLIPVHPCDVLPICELGGAPPKSLQILSPESAPKPESHQENLSRHRPKPLGSVEKRGVDI